MKSIKINFTDKLFFFIFFYSLFVFLFFNVITDNIGFFYDLKKDEFFSNFLSLTAAGIFWVSFCNSVKKEIGTTILKILTYCVIIKISLSFLNIYLFQLQFFGYDLTTQISYGNGDSGLINDKVVEYSRQFPNLLEKFFNTSGLLNNKGTLVLYSFMYEAFGSRPSVVIPWDSLAIALYSLTFCLISKLIFKDKNYNSLVLVSVFFLPLYLISPLLYRDVYIVLLISCVVFLIFFNNKNYYLKTFLYLVFLSICIGSLRKAYVVLPFSFWLIYFFVKNQHLLKYYLLIFFSILLLISTYIFLNQDLIFTNSYQRYLNAELNNKNLFIDFFNYIQLIINHGARSGGEFIGFFEKQTLIIKFFFRSVVLLISPFPWYVNISKENIAYSLAHSSQILISFAIYFHIFNLILKKKINQDFLIILIFFILIFLIAVLGALQFSSYYILVGLPMLMTSLSKANSLSLRKYLSLSLLFFFTLHTIHFFLKLYIF